MKIDELIIELQKLKNEENMSREVEVLIGMDETNPITKKLIRVSTLADECIAFEPAWEWNQPLLIMEE